MAANNCLNVDLLYIMSYLRTIVDALKIIAPLVLIIAISVDILKAVVARDQDGIAKNLKRIPNRLLLCALIILLPTIVEFIVGNVESTNQSIACFKSATKENVQVAYQDLALSLIKSAEEQVNLNPYEAKVSMDEIYSAIMHIDDQNLAKTLKERADAIEEKLNSSRSSSSSHSSGGHSFSSSDIGRSDIVSYANNFIGLQYIWGGTSLSSGVDCSGFVLNIMQHFGINMPRTAAEQSQVGTLITGIENARPGDLLFYRSENGVSHVAIYAGKENGQHIRIHASGGRACPNSTLPCRVIKANVGNYAFIKRVTN